MNKNPMTTTATKSNKAHESLSGTPTWVTQGRVPCLDGFRALSIFVVVLYHCNLMAQNRWTKILPDGHLGVTFFFVISGFLITLLMLRETNRTGTLSLRDFYRRRTLRIVPALGAYLTVLFVCQQLGFLSYQPHIWLGAITYTLCFMDRSGAGFLSHLWSLSVEEHFYLIWPLLFHLAKPAKAFRILLGYLLLLPLLRYALWAYGNRGLDIEFCSPTQMGSIATGCVVAFSVNQTGIKPLTKEAAAKMRRLLPLSTVGSAALLAASVVAARISGLYNILFSDPVNAACLAVFMVSVLYTEKSFLFRIMNTKPVIWLGILSYSIYLWQQPFTNGVVGRSLSHWPLALTLIVGLASASYLFVETPFLRWKDKGKPSDALPQNAAISSAQMTTATPNLETGSVG